MPPHLLPPSPWQLLMVLACQHGMGVYLSKVGGGVKGVECLGADVTQVGNMALQ
jgi:hypothetical protein